MKVRRERGRKSYTLMLLGTGENTGIHTDRSEDAPVSAEKLPEARASIY